MPSRLAVYMRTIDRVLKEGGPYDVVHTHYDVSGPTLFAAARNGVPVRMVTSHSQAPELRFWPAWRRRLVSPLARGAMRRHATHGAGVSESAAVSRFGAAWRKDPRWTIQRCGIDVEPFRTRPNRSAWRASRDIPPDAVVMTHVGRFGPPKNQERLIAMAADAKSRGIPFRMVLLGDGPFRARLERDARRLGVEGEVLFPGIRTDVAEWLGAASDVLVFPSLHEGLPLAVIEAQAAGVPVLMSDRITAEAAVVPGLVRRFPLEAPAAAWVDEALRIARDLVRPSAAEAWRRVAESAFNIDNAAAALESFYVRELSGIR